MTLSVGLMFNDYCSDLDARVRKALKIWVSGVSDNYGFFNKFGQREIEEMIKVHVKPTPSLENISQ